MTICDLSTGLILLQRGTKKLREVWSETKEHWTDKTSSDFENEHLQTMIAHVTITASAVQRLAEALQKAEQACGDDDRLE
jgi:hypothetical protein